MCRISTFFQRLCSIECARSAAAPSLATAWSGYSRGPLCARPSTPKASTSTSEQHMGPPEVCGGGGDSGGDGGGGAAAARGALLRLHAAQRRFCCEALSGRRALKCFHLCLVRERLGMTGPLKAREARALASQNAGAGRFWWGCALCVLPCFASVQVLRGRRCRGGWHALVAAPGWLRGAMLPPMRV